ncbi:translation initiation factor eIF-2B epsilon subunit, GEF, partial [Dimargaris verticillata]
MAWEPISRCSKWSGTQSPFEVHTIFSQEALSVGDVLRELDTKSLVRTDFILIQGDVVANMDLAKALEAHKDRKTEDKNSIMTMVVKEASPDHQTRGHQDAIYAINPASQQCVHFVPSRQGLTTAKSISLSVELLAKHPELELRYDLMDCQIDICSVEVPALFTENFDYQDIRRDFVPGILGSEVLDSTFYVYPITSEYAARASSGQLYDAISRDVISRWTFPMVPDCNLLEDDQYTHQRNLVYKATNVILARTSHLQCNVVIGSRSVVGEHATIAHSVIGRNCRIGNHVTIEGAYLLDGTVVKDGCQIR